MPGGSVRKAGVPARSPDTVVTSHVALPRVLVLGLAALAVCVALLASTAAPPPQAQRITTTQSQPASTQSQTRSTPSTTTRSPLERAADQNAPHSRWNDVVFTILGITVSVGFLLLGLVFLVVLATGVVLLLTRLGASVRFRIVRQEVSAPLNAVTEESERLEAVPAAVRRRQLLRGSVREEVVACWADLEDAAEHAGLARFDHETSTEFADRLRMARPVDALALRHLLELFREARFSEHELPEAARSQATGAVARLQRDLGGAAVPTTGGGPP